MTAPAASPPLDEVTTGLLDLFRVSGRTVYDGDYDGDPVKAAYPYGLLYPIPGGAADPMPGLDLDFRTVTATWQVSAISNFRNQAEQTRRVFFDLLLARTGGDWTYPLPPLNGWSVIDRRPDVVPAGVIRTGQTPNAIFTAPLRFTLTICPA